MSYHRGYVQGPGAIDRRDRRSVRQALGAVPSACRVSTEYVQWPDGRVEKVPIKLAETYPWCASRTGSTGGAVGKLTSVFVPMLKASTVSMATSSGLSKPSASIGISSGSGPLPGSTPIGPSAVPTPTGPSGPLSPFVPPSRPPPAPTGPLPGSSVSPIGPSIVKPPASSSPVSPVAPAPAAPVVTMSTTTSTPYVPAPTPSQAPIYQQVSTLRPPSSDTLSISTSGKPPWLVIGAVALLAGVLLLKKK